MGFPVSKVHVDGQNCVLWSAKAARADTIYTGTCTQLLTAMHPTPESTALSAYYQFSAVGRNILLEGTSFE